jgi:hypothetical protein
MEQPASFLETLIEFLRALRERVAIFEVRLGQNSVEM